MGWGTTFNAEIYISRQHFQTAMEVEDKISELKEYIRRDKNKILMFCAANPKDISPDEWDGEVIVFIHNSVEELLDSIEENERMLYDLYLLKDNFDNHTKD